MGFPKIDEVVESAGFVENKFVEDEAEALNKLVVEEGADGAGVDDVGVFPKMFIFGASFEVVDVAVPKGRVEAGFGISAAGFEEPKSDGPNGVAVEEAPKMDDEDDGARVAGVVVVGVSLFPIDPNMLDFVPRSLAGSLLDGPPKRLLVLFANSDDVVVVGAAGGARMLVVVAVESAGFARFPNSDPTGFVGSGAVVVTAEAAGFPSEKPNPVGATGVVVARTTDSGAASGISASFPTPNPNVAAGLVAVELPLPTPNETALPVVASGLKARSPKTLDDDVAAEAYMT